ncbi:MAG: cytosine permease [Jatrophihabitans sp.]|uniref:purine-cytosine permease family protein n=1 Tax=Jatrophihabitans sp. TaxID=1932789 RepID=UPI00390F6974
MTTTIEHAEAPLTLDQPAPRALRLIDQLGMWGNLGVSLLGFTGAIYVLYPLGTTALSLAAAFTALVLGTLLGSAAISVAGAIGTETGAPSMVLLRGLFGARVSWLPTVLNVVQLLGWTSFELVTISTALHQISDGVPRWVYVLAGGVVTTGLALYPLSWIRLLRRYVTVAVVIALGYLAVQLLRNPLPSWGHGSWSGFWIAVDTVIGVGVSWVPVAADYTRHSKSVRDTVAGTFVGYSVTQIACYAIGLITLVTVAKGDANQIFGSFMAIPVGTLAFAVLAIREVDQSFVDTYSTAVSVQNLRPRWDRRVLATVIGVLATVFALVLNVNDYANFLLLIGSVFVPLLGVLAVDYYVVSRREWDLSETSPARSTMLAPWLLGFIAYQLINAGYVGWWSRGWTRIDSWLHFTPTTWMSASLVSFAVSAVATVPVGLLRRGGRARRREEHQC